MAKIKHLNEYHKRAIEMKYKGDTYQGIADRLNDYAQKSRISRRFTTQTVKDWFKASGTLAEAYCIYEQEMDDIHRETMDVVRKAGIRIRDENFRLANEMLIALMGSPNDNVKLGTIKELLDRVEGKPKEYLAVEENHLTIEQLAIEYAKKKTKEQE